MATLATNKTRHKRNGKWDSPFGDAHVHTTWRQEYRSSNAGEDMLDALMNCDGSEDSSDDFSDKEMSDTPCIGATRARHGVVAHVSPSVQKCASVFTNAKAGMEEVDTKRINEVVSKAQQSSAFAIQQDLVDNKLEDHIVSLIQRGKDLTENQLRVSERVCVQRMSDLEGHRDLSRIWVHVDMDMFYAAVEIQDNPSLAKVPMAVGEGVILTANYIGRTYGVRSAMPGHIARQLCPELVVVPSHYDRYHAVSETIRDVFRVFDPTPMFAGLDEAYIDVTEYCRKHHVTGCQAANQIRAQVVEATGGLTCSAGVASNRMLAKMASEVNKPNGCFALPANRTAIRDFMGSLPLRKIPGIGRANERTLQALGCVKCQDVLEKRATLFSLLSPKKADFVLAVSMGIGSSQKPPPVAAGHIQRHGISHQSTFPALSTIADMASKLAETADVLSEHLSDEGLSARQLTLKLKYTSFEVHTKSVLLPSAVQTAAAISNATMPLLLALQQKSDGAPPNPIRQLGLQAGNFFGEFSNTDDQQRTMKNFLETPVCIGADSLVSPVMQPKSPAAAEMEEQGDARRGSASSGGHPRGAKRSSAGPVHQRPLKQAKLMWPWGACASGVSK